MACSTCASTGASQTSQARTLDAGQRRVRPAKIVAAIEHCSRAPAEWKPAVRAVADYMRDAAFTVLNRFVALKMLEARRSGAALR